ncbi:hypothetical protein BASA_1689 [Bifidobacterium animalis subsp. animalis]|nr:hypothetical protein BASA_1689 [Bifidobacterium animalis subsp. animalis]
MSGLPQCGHCTGPSFSYTIAGAHGETRGGDDFIVQGRAQAWAIYKGPCDRVQSQGPSMLKLRLVETDRSRS